MKKKTMEQIINDALAQFDYVKRGGIEAWRGYEFESSSGLTEEFALFSKQIKTHLVKTMTGYELINYSRGHFYFSAFMKNNRTDKLVYVSCSDVRYSPDGWYNNLLVCTAQHDKDYTGGSNDWATLVGLKAKADMLTR
jgi:hypothetical protein